MPAHAAKIQAADKFNDKALEMIDVLLGETQKGYRKKAREMLDELRELRAFIRDNATD